MMAANFIADIQIRAQDDARSALSPDADVFIPSFVTSEAHTDVTSGKKSQRIPRYIMNCYPFVNNSQPSPIVNNGFINSLPQSMYDRQTDGTNFYGSSMSYHPTHIPPPKLEQCIPSSQLAVPNSKFSAAVMPLMYPLFQPPAPLTAPLHHNSFSPFFRPPALPRKAALSQDRWVRPRLNHSSTNKKFSPSRLQNRNRNNAQSIKSKQGKSKLHNNVIDTNNLLNASKDISIQTDFPLEICNFTLQQVPNTIFQPQEIQQPYQSDVFQVSFLELSTRSHTMTSQGTDPMPPLESFNYCIMDLKPLEVLASLPTVAAECTSVNGDPVYSNYSSGLNTIIMRARSHSGDNPFNNIKKDSSNMLKQSMDNDCNSSKDQTETKLVKEEMDVCHSINKGVWSHRYKSSEHFTLSDFLLTNVDLKDTNDQLKKFNKSRNAKFKKKFCLKNPDKMGKDTNREHLVNEYTEYSLSKDFPNLSSTLQPTVNDGNGKTENTSSYSDALKTGALEATVQILTNDKPDIVASKMDVKAARKLRKRREKANRAAKHELAEISFEQTMLKELKNITCTPSDTQPVNGSSTMSQPINPPSLMSKNSGKNHLFENVANVISNSAVNDMSNDNAQFIKKDRNCNLNEMLTYKGFTHDLSGSNWPELGRHQSINSPKGSTKSSKHCDPANLMNASNESSDVSGWPSLNEPIKKSGQSRRLNDDPVEKNSVYTRPKQLQNNSVDSKGLISMDVVKKHQYKPPKKSEEPLTLDISEMLTTKQNKKSEVSLEKSPIQPGTPQVHKGTSSSAGNVAHNLLDSSAPCQKRGKERETPKQKKPSSLKKVILKEREEKKRLREEFVDKDMNEEVKCVEKLVEKEENIGDSDLSQDAVSKSGTHSNPTSCELSPISQPSPMLFTPLSSGLASPLNSSHAQAMMGVMSMKIHSRRFREYCKQILDKEIDLVCTNLLQDLVRFQTRAVSKDPVKAKSKRRIVLGLREVTKHLKLRKIKCVIISPNLEKIQSKGGLDDALNNVIELCSQQNLPFVFALGRCALGWACGKMVPVSVVGVFNYSGSDENYKKLMDLTVKAQEAYKEMVLILEREANEAPLKGSVYTSAGHSRTPSACSAVSLTSSILSEPISENYPHSEHDSDHDKDISSNSVTTFEESTFNSTSACKHFQDSESVANDDSCRFSMDTEFATGNDDSGNLVSCNQNRVQFDSHITNNVLDLDYLKADSDCLADGRNKCDNYKNSDAVRDNLLMVESQMDEKKVTTTCHHYKQEIMANNTVDTLHNAVLAAAVDCDINNDSNDNHVNTKQQKTPKAKNHVQARVIQCGCNFGSLYTGDNLHPDYDKSSKFPKFHRNTNQHIDDEDKGMEADVEDLDESESLVMQMNGVCLPKKPCNKNDISKSICQDI